MYTSTLRFAPWQSDVDMQFYAALAHIKINHDMLDDSARKILGLYEVRPADHPTRSMRVQIHPNAITSDEYAFHICMLWEVAKQIAAHHQRTAAPKASSRTATR